MNRNLDSVLARFAFDQPFFATLIAMTDLVETSAFYTLATDGLRIYYNPEFTEKLTADELMGVLAHELMHIVYLHCDNSRRKGRDSQVWNAAGDFAINQELKGWGFKLPAGCLCMPKKFGGKTTETIYDELIEIQMKCQCQDKLISACGDDAREAEGRVITAAAKNPGRVPGDLDRWIKRIKESRVPWERLLRKFLSEATRREEESFLPPNRRHLWDGRYQPSVRTGRGGRIVAAIDTSGSINQKNLDAFATELGGLVDIVDEVHVVSCDAKVQAETTLKGFKSEIMKLNFKGGGGTDFRPVFDAVAKKKPPPDALVYLTDGLGRFPKTAPRFPVLWCLTGPAEIPWGRGILLP